MQESRIKPRRAGVSGMLCSEIKYARLVWKRVAHVDKDFLGIHKI